MSDATRELPRYQCHKKVWAVKIKSIENQPEGWALIEPEESGYAKISIEAAFVEKFKPSAGGYFVIYSDGYRSYSPAAAFEDGYSLITN